MKSKKERKKEKRKEKKRKTTELMKRYKIKIFKLGFLDIVRG